MTRQAQYLQELRGHDAALVERSLRDHPQVKVRDLVRLLEDDGWYLVRTRGSHRQYKHLQKRGLVTVAGKSNDDLASGTLNSVLKQAGLKT
jgi:predicted RNA binding protein YcfA (HicA-like mRNA interferase family)